MQKITEITEYIRSLDSLNKSQASPDRDKQLRDLRHQFSQLFIAQHDFLLKRLKLNQYTAGNKVGSFLARQIRKKSAKNRIAYLLDSKNNRIINPAHIAEKFAEFYSNLYNINSDNLPKPPTDAQIQNFLHP